MVTPPPWLPAVSLVCSARVNSGVPTYMVAALSPFHEATPSALRNSRATRYPSFCTPAGIALKNPDTMPSGWASSCGPSGVV